LIVDDHAVVRQGLRMFLGLDGDLQIVGEAATGAEALRLARELRPDVVLMDLLMPEMDGIAATAAIRRELPKTEVLALTSVLGDHSVVEAIQAGAVGYLLKNTEAYELRRAIKAAAAGQAQVSPEAATRLVRGIGSASTARVLTDREVEVLRLVAKGQANKEIAARLHVSETTVKTHVKNLMDKLDVPSRMHAALYAVRTGLVSVEELGGK
jgi:DNA-binding NarL/FixJ family response regulator